MGAMELAERFDVGFVTHSNVDREDIEAHGLRFGTRGRSSGSTPSASSTAASRARTWPG